LLARLEDEFSAPDVIVPELGNILWNKLRRGDMSSGRANAVADIVSDPEQFPVILVPAQALISSAIRIATEFDRSVYDALYLAVAAELGAPLITADARLVNAMSGSAEWHNRVELLGGYSGGP
jgi:predicted nucleic acid-binding protein